MDESELSDAEKRANVLRLAFDDDEEKFDEFLRVIRQEIPSGTGVVLRGSAVTGRRWSDGAQFDEVIGLFTATGFFVPGIHSRPLSDDDPNIAPALVPLRETLMTMTGRPVNIQATRKAAMRFRGETLGQPYLTLIDNTEGS
jgi:hypothetical protein